MAQCKTCLQQIVWGVTANGKRVPLDPAEKRYVLLHMLEGPAGVARSDDEYGMVDTHLSHFATCPQADQHRKEKTDG
jgi:hypothetical protein